MLDVSRRAVRFLRRKKTKQTNLYCDYAAATPVSKDVATQMDTITRTIFGNPGAIHQAGVKAAQVVDGARTALARCLGVRPTEVFFTASGTEANNLAIQGLLDTRVQEGAVLSDLHVITTRLEHPSVLQVLAKLEMQGLQVTYAPVDAVGKIDTNKLAALLTPHTALVTFAYANSEVGTVQDVRRIARIVQKFNTEHGTKIVTHLDAAQAPLWLPCQLHQLGVDMMSLDAGKCNGPKGVGVLVKRAAITLSSIMPGGGQESGLRSGTENTAAIAGASQAIVAAQEQREVLREDAHALSRALADAIQEHVPQAVFNGPAIDGATEELERLPNNVHISLPGFDTEYAVIYLDKHGVAASTRSACSGADGGASAVVQEITSGTALAASTIRFSIDPTLSPGDMKYIAKTLADFVALQSELR